MKRIPIKLRRMVHDQFKAGRSVFSIACEFLTSTAWVEQSLREAMKAADRKLKRRKG